MMLLLPQAARDIVEVEGVHAIVGPNASSAALPISQGMSSATLGIPTISPSATSPQLTDVEDNGYFFRTALSDAAQGPVLAQVTRGRGFDNVGCALPRRCLWRKGWLPPSKSPGMESFSGSSPSIRPRRASFRSWPRARIRGCGGVGCYRFRGSGPVYRARGYR